MKANKLFKPVPQFGTPLPLPLYNDRKESSLLKIIIMAISNVSVTNSRIGITSIKKRIVKQLVTLEIQYEDPSQSKTKIVLGIRDRTSLCFHCKHYFGISYQKEDNGSKVKTLDLIDENGEHKITIPMPKGKLIVTYEEMFIFKNKDDVYAYDITGAIVAKGKFPTDGSNNLDLTYCAIE